MSLFIENNISTRDEDIFNVNFGYFLVILFDSEISVALEFLAHKKLELLMYSILSLLLMPLILRFNAFLSNS